MCPCVRVCVCVTDINHVLPAFGLSTEQGLVVGQSGVVDADVHALVHGLYGREHGQDLLLVGQIALVGNECAAVTGALAFCSQLLQTHTRTHNMAGLATAFSFGND